MSVRTIAPMYRLPDLEWGNIQTKMLPPTPEWPHPSYPFAVGHIGDMNVEIRTTTLPDGPGDVNLYIEFWDGPPYPSVEAAMMAAEDIAPGIYADRCYLTQV